MDEVVFVVTWNNGEAATLYTAQELADWLADGGEAELIQSVDRWVANDEGWVTI